MFRKEINVGIIIGHRSNGAMKHLVKVRIDDNIITFLNVYATCNENARIALFEAHVGCKFSQQYTCTIVKVLKRFKLQFWKKNDKLNERFFETINNLIRSCISVGPQTYCCVWFVMMQIIAPKSRIDYILISKDLIDSTKTYNDKNTRNIIGKQESVIIGT